MSSIEFREKIVSISPKLFLVALRLLRNEEEAKDAVQDVMVRLWKKRKELGSHPNPSAYACLTIRNHCLDILRKTEPSKSNENNINEVAICIDNSINIEHREVVEIIEKIIASLPDKQSMIVLMRDIDGLEFEEIEMLTGIRKEIIRVTLSRARKSIREQLEKIYSYESGTARQASGTI
ncbi:MAG: RNA polymerase sigma factor [Bacteroidales bacterium]|nr:RNA polymerase sigma factor [Bacteroidales bacterium]